MDIAVPERQTKYCQAIEDGLRELGHATNSQLLGVLRASYPEVSATTVHRATARLAARGKIAVAPSGQDGATRYDTNTTAHDHFLCSACGRLRDTDIKDKVVPVLVQSLDGCNISGRLTISGVCKQCNTHNSKGVINQ